MPGAYKLCSNWKSKTSDVQRKQTDKQWYLSPFLSLAQYVFGNASVAGCWGLTDCSMFAITSTAAPCKTPSCTSPGGWKCPSSCREWGGKRRSCQLTRQRNCVGFMQQTGTGLSVTPLIAPHALPYSSSPRNPPGMAVNWAVQSDFFFCCATMKWHTALFCVLNSVVKMSTKICTHRAEQQY